MKRNMGGKIKCMDFKSKVWIHRTTIEMLFAIRGRKFIQPKLNWS